MFVLFSYVFFTPGQTQAYPPPITSTPYPGPYPGPPAQPTPLPPILMSTLLTHSVYLPMVHRPLYIRLSVGGAFNGGVKRLVTEVISSQFAIDAYHWNKLPNQSQIQIIRSCLAYRKHYQIGDRKIYLPYYNTSPNHVCWDPFSQELRTIVLTTLVEIWGETWIDCPYQTCLQPDEAEIRFRNWAEINPEQIWLIGNEPDLIEQDSILDDFFAFVPETVDPDTDPTSWTVTTESLPKDGPTTYAIFYANIYRLVQESIGFDYAPRLVFCQSVSPDRTIPEKGLNYCEAAFAALPDALEAELGHTIPMTEAIYALATHNYLKGVHLIAGQTYTNGQLLDMDILPQAVQKHWIEPLQVFEQWAVDVGLGDKPLWLTEFGAGQARCHEVHTPDDGVLYEEGGLDCVGKGGNNVFYGRNSHEGLWGLQTLQINYLNQPDNNWEAAWWFVSTVGKVGDMCTKTGWIWGDDYDCIANVTKLSRAGEILQQTVLCYLRNDHSACPRPADLGGAGGGIDECLENSRACEDPNL